MSAVKQFSSYIDLDQTQGWPILFSLRQHTKHHARFYISATIGIAVGFCIGNFADGPLRFIIAGDSFFAVYLIVTGMFMSRQTPERMRKRSDFEDEGILVITLITLTAVSLSLGAIFMVLHSSGTDVALMIFSLFSVPLGWLTFHTVQIGSASCRERVGQYV